MDFIRTGIKLDRGAIRSLTLVHVLVNIFHRGKTLAGLDIDVGSVLPAQIAIVDRIAVVLEYGRLGEGFGQRLLQRPSRMQNLDCNSHMAGASCSWLSRHARTGHSRHLGGYHGINSLGCIGGILYPEEGVRARKTSFLVFDYRSISDIFAKNLVNFQTVH